jgi:hypothetical protein
MAGCMLVFERFWIDYCDLYNIEEHLLTEESVAVWKIAVEE